MSGLTSLVDTMLPSKLAQRVDLVPLKPEVEIAGTDAVASVEKVSNDVRLPSRAAMLRQLGPGPIDVHDMHDGASTPRTATTSALTTLSAAARAISAILGPTPGIASPVRGSAPVWSQPGAPVPQQLAAALARTVATSGLFYESHLSQFASGARSLAELAQEPQARLGQLQQIPPELSADKVQPQAGLHAAVQASAQPGLQAALQPTLQDGDLATAAPASATTAAANQASPAVTVAPAMAVASAMTDAVLAPNVTTHIAGAANPAGSHQLAAGTDTRADAAPQPHNVGASHRLTSANIAAAYNASDTAALPQSDAQHSQSTQPDSGIDKSTQSIVPDAVRGSSQVAGMHQDAVALVRQQLELLAAPVFRWSGEVWPGTQMDWELHEERNHQQENPDVQVAPPTWQTRLTMTLPTLGAIEVRLSMVDAQLQAHLAASEETSIALLRNDGDDLRQRFAAAGLQLTGLQIAPLEQKP